MVVPVNQLQQVQTYQNVEIADLLNNSPVIDIANKKLSQFQNLTGNLGDTVNIELTTRSLTANGLVVQSFDPAVQRVLSLTVANAVNGSAAFTDQQFIFNVEDYMKTFGTSRMANMGSSIESDLSKLFISDFRVNNPQASNYGQILEPKSGPYRFFGYPTSPLTSMGALAQAAANFRDFGSAQYNYVGIIPTPNVPQIVDTALNQFALKRNDDIAMSWELGTYSRVRWLESNLLPIHNSGTVGNAQTTLTVTGTVTNSQGYITGLTCSGASASDVNALKNGDLGQFQDGVSGKVNMRFLTWIGQAQTQQPVQIRVVGDTASDGSGNITFSIYPYLVSLPTQDQNINTSVQPGMQLKFLASHRAGILMSGDPLFVAFPKLPDMSPYMTVSTQDPESGLSIRHYWGAGLGNNTRGYIWDQIYGGVLVAENSMRLIFPV